MVLSASHLLIHLLHLLFMLLCSRKRAFYSFSENNAFTDEFPLPKSCPNSYPSSPSGLHILQTQFQCPLFWSFPNILSFLFHVFRGLYCVSNTEFSMLHSSLIFNMCVFVCVYVYVFVCVCLFVCVCVLADLTINYSRIHLTFLVSHRMENTSL